MPRRSTEDTRALLLEIAVGMLHDQGVHAGVSHIRVKDVVHKAGLTTGAAYACWPDQESFQRDLALAAVAWRDSASIAGTVKRIRTVVESGAPLHELIRVGAEANLRSYPGDTAFLSALALRASAHGDERLEAASHRRYTESLQAYAELHAAMLRVYHRRLLPPFTLEHLTVALAALSEGFAVQAAGGEAHPSIDIRDVPEGTGTDWTLFGVVAMAIVEKFTEPDEVS